MNGIRFSIITAVYNNVNTIEQAISSVLEQKGVAVEYIIIDGASIDGTIDMIKKYDSRIRWISEPDTGIYDALNKGIKMAEGEYIQIIGADDCLCDDMILSKVDSCLREHGEPDVLCTGRLLVDEQTGMEVIEQDNLELVRRGKARIIWTPHTGMYVKSSLMKQELFDERFKIGADYFFILRCYYKLKWRFEFVGFPVAYFSNGGVSNFAKEKADKENEKIFAELGLKSLNTRKWSKAKNLMKRVLYILGLMDFVKDNVLLKNRPKKHKCNNKICRWCGRK